MAELKLEQNCFNFEQNKAFEGLMTQGNGYFHVRACFEEGLADAPQNEAYTRTMTSVTNEVQRSPVSKCGTYIPLIMGNHPLLGEAIVNLPYFMDVRLCADGEKLDMIRCSLTEYTRTLGLKTGELIRNITWKTKSGCLIHLEFRRFASMDDPRLFAQHICCKVLTGNPQLSWTSGVDADVTTNGYSHFHSVIFEDAHDVLRCRVRTDTGFDVSICSALVFERGQPELQIDKYETSGGFTWRQTGIPGEAFSFCKLTALATSRDSEDSDAAAMQSLNRAKPKTYRVLLLESASKWDAYWENSRVSVCGDNELQQGLDLSVYHMLRCNTGMEERIQVCAKGFAGEAYYGRYFWDSEIYLLPFYLYTNPKAARTMLMYRYHTLDGARRNAARYRCKGARYPWQSGLYGDEQCSLWEYADNEIHITADVAFAVTHYFRATDDFAFLFGYGLEILIETARFWLDRIDYGTDGAAHLLNVMGPDEYSPMTRDNAYTNRLARFNLEAAAQYSMLAAERDPEAYARLTEKINFRAEELKDFTEAAGLLALPYDHKRDLYLQSADFEDYAVIDIEALWTDKKKPFGGSVAQEKIYRSRCIKQADVVALMTLFPHEFTDHQIEAAYNYHMPMTVHDSSLSPAGHSIIANRLGKENETEAFLHQALGIDFSIDSNGAQDGIHIANCGCLWQLVTAGFAGMDSALWSSEPVFIPKMPKKITTITFPFIWKGGRYRVTVNGNSTTFVKSQN